MSIKNVKDMLTQKQEKLKKVSEQYSVVTAAVAGIVESLTDIGNDINESLDEINTYKKELDVTADGLRAAQERNAKVMANFKALLSID